MADLLRVEFLVDCVVHYRPDHKIHPQEHEAKQEMRQRILERLHRRLIRIIQELKRIKLVIVGDGVDEENAEFHEEFCAAHVVEPFLKLAGALYGETFLLYILQ